MLKESGVCGKWTTSSSSSSSSSSSQNVDKKFAYITKITPNFESQNQKKTPKAPTPAASTTTKARRNEGRRPLTFCASGSKCTKAAANKTPPAMPLQRLKISWWLLQTKPFLQIEGLYSSFYWKVHVYIESNMCIYIPMLIYVLSYMFMYVI